MIEEIKILNEYVEKSKNAVFFGGAGVSTESGIPDFRSSDGLYNEKYSYPPETILSHSFFYNHTEEFFKFYRDKMLYLNALPNEAHKKLAEMEKKGKLSAVITQNIDGLHYAAGSKTVYELHGSVLRNTCLKCGKKFGVESIVNSNAVPHCDCGGIIKPDVVLYGESLDGETVENAVNAISQADLLIIGGTSLSVYPASGLIDYFNGDKLVIINRAPTLYDRRASLLISDLKVGEAMKEVKL